jgi:hypothetical protein
MITNKSYQRRHLRAPYKENVLYGDADYVLRARAVNISAGGILLDQLPSFPAQDEVPLLLSIPQLPHLKNYSLLKIQTLSTEIFNSNVIRVRARLARREELSLNIDNIFRSRFGLEYVELGKKEEKTIQDYVEIFSSNLIYLQLLIDTFNSDEETKIKARALAKFLGYNENEKIANLRNTVASDYKSLQWL